MLPKISCCQQCKNKGDASAKFKLHACTTTTRKQQNKQGNKNKRRESCSFFLGEGEGDIFVDNFPSLKIPKAQITFLIKI